MANPQKEDGFTPIANAIMEALGRYRIPGEERQVLDVIFRQTYGWRTCVDAISLTQFVEKTGMKKPNVVSAINRLLSKKIIIVMQKDNDKTKNYKINKNYDEWVTMSKRATSSPTVMESHNVSLCKTITPSVQPVMQNHNEPLCKPITTVMESHNKSLWKSIPTKERVKETIKESFKDNYVASDEALRLGDLLFSEIIKENSKSRLANQNTAAKEKTITGWALDIEKLIGIDKQEPSTVEEVIFFATHDDFWGANILSGKKLREKWDTLTMKMKQKGQKNGFTKPTGIEPFSDIPKALRGNW